MNEYFVWTAGIPPMKITESSVDNAVQELCSQKHVPLYVPVYVALVDDVKHQIIGLAA